MNSKMIKQSLKDVLEILVISTAVIVFCWFFIAEPFEVSGDSMEPTIHDGEFLLTDKISLKFKDIERGEIVVFESPENPGTVLVKRVIGLPGEKVRIENGDIYINGERLDENSYVAETHATNGKNIIDEGEEQIIGATEYLLLGDNRNNSFDSRNFGFIDIERIESRVISVIFPVENARRIN